MSSARAEADLRSRPSPVPVDHPLALLESRRSVPIPMLTEPGPSREELRRMLTIAVRVPDHGGLEPWRFIIIAGEARRQASEELAPIFVAENAAMEAGKRRKFANVVSRLFTHAPLVVIVVSRADPVARVPVGEQELSAGAVCMNLLHAARGLGFAGTWLTGWAAYSTGAHRVLGVDQGEKIAGIVHIGTPTDTAADRKRPDLDAIVTGWKSGSRE